MGKEYRITVREIDMTKVDGGLGNYPVIDEVVTEEQVAEIELFLEK